jgi:hypothetical protein
VRYADEVSGPALRRFALCACLVSIGWACTLLNPLDEYGPGKPKRDASTEGGSGAGDGGRVLEHWPDPPTKDDGTEKLDLVFAATKVNLTPTVNGVARGYDLDGVWTCPDPPSCTNPSQTGSNCDADGGVDQAGSDLVGSGLALAGVGTEDAIAKGNHGFLIKLQLYNGGQNDPQVAVALFSSQGTTPDANGDSTKPQHDGNDVWTIDPASVSGGLSASPPYAPNTFDAKAYVTDGTLVARADIRLDLGDFVIKVVGGAVTAKIVRNGNTFALTDGRLVGRWPTKDLLSSLDTLRAPGSSTEGVCGTNVFYQTLKKQICGAADLSSNPSLDNKAGTTCDAVGMAVLFEAEAAQMGGLLPGKAPKHLCGDAWSDSCQ